MLELVQVRFIKYDLQPLAVWALDGSRCGGLGYAACWSIHVGCGIDWYILVGYVGRSVQANGGCKQKMVHLIECIYDGR